jgi:hypothetical protein
LLKAQVDNRPVGGGDVLLVPFFWQGNGNISFQSQPTCFKSLIFKGSNIFKNGRIQKLGEYHKSAMNYTNYTKKLRQLHEIHEICGKKSGGYLAAQLVDTPFKNGQN